MWNQISVVSLISWCCTLLIGRQRQVDYCEFEDSLAYVESSGQPGQINNISAPIRFSYGQSWLNLNMPKPKHTYLWERNYLALWLWLSFLELTTWNGGRVVFPNPISWNQQGLQKFGSVLGLRSSWKRKSRQTTSRGLVHLYEDDSSPSLEHTASFYLKPHSQHLHSDISKSFSSVSLKLKLLSPPNLSCFPRLCSVTSIRQ